MFPHSTDVKNIWRVQISKFCSLVSFHKTQTFPFLIVPVVSLRLANRRTLASWCRKCANCEICVWEVWAGKFLELVIIFKAYYIKPHFYKKYPPYFLEAQKLFGDLHFTKNQTLCSWFGRLISNHFAGQRYHFFDLKIKIY